MRSRCWCKVMHSEFFSQPATTQRYAARAAVEIEACILLALHAFHAQRVPSWQDYGLDSVVHPSHSLRVQHYCPTIVPTLLAECMTL